MRPTIEKIEKIMRENGPIVGSKRIYALYNPVIKPMSEMGNNEITEEIEHIKQQVDIMSERRLNLEREMFFRNNPDINP